MKPPTNFISKIPATYAVSADLYLRCHPPDPLSSNTSLSPSPNTRKIVDHPAMASRSDIVFEDFFPSMVEKLGEEGFINELCNGFRLLMDGEKKEITFESLKKNSAVLGLQDLNDDELMCMVREGDLDGNGSLNQMEFCVLMFRLSPELMKRSKRLVIEAVMKELEGL
ncbi:unnamed protein product [Ilex paraguariensis]|uniref:EF-hand domain-containing protein n=2 Tax=Ilex paraguariensis TaxID=185542 RepID=A0ABC8TIX9_9AQUA